MSAKVYRQNAWNQEICEQYSWRNILCQRYGLTNLNFAVSGSSNQKQFRLARNYFSSEKFQSDLQKYKKIIVLWGITSTARNEVFLSEQQRFVNFLYTHPSPQSKFFLVNVYDHVNEVNELRRNMEHWNMVFGSLGIDNYWFDSFNTHDYKNIKWYDSFPTVDNYQAVAGSDWPNYQQFCQRDFTHVAEHIITEMKSIYHSCAGFIDPKLDNIKCMIDADQSPRDLLSWLSQIYNFNNNDQRYQYNDWVTDYQGTDDPKIMHLVKQGVLNPISNHPTKLGHEKIADYFSMKVSKNF